MAGMGFSREIWSKLGSTASQGRAAWQRSANRGGAERVLWIAATVLFAIPIFALLLLALLGALALTLAALMVAWIWGMLARLGVGGSRNEVTVIRVSRPRSFP